NQCHAFLVAAANFGRTFAHHDFSHSGQRYRALALGVDDEVAHGIDRLPLLFRNAHQHIDLAVPPTVTGCDASANLADHLVGNFLDGQTQGGSTLLVEENLHFRMAPFHTRFHIGKPV